MKKQTTQEAHTMNTAAADLTNYFISALKGNTRTSTFARQQKDDMLTAMQNIAKAATALENIELAWIIGGAFDESKFTGRIIYAAAEFAIENNIDYTGYSWSYNS